MFLLEPENDLLSQRKPERQLPAAIEYLPLKGEALSISDLEYPKGEVRLTMNSTIRSAVRELSESSEAINTIEIQAVEICN